MSVLEGNYCLVFRLLLSNETVKKDQIEPKVSETAPGHIDDFRGIEEGGQDVF